MKRYFFAILFSVVSLFSLCAQEEPVDPKAKAVLDKAVAKFSSKKGVEALFDISLENEQNGKKETISGSLLLKGAKFKLAIRDIVTYFDGKTQYVYMPDGKEVTVSEPEKEEMKNVNPIIMIQSYKTDFMMKLVETKQVNGKPVDVINLYPNDRKKDFSVMSLEIEQGSLKLLAVKLHGKNGVNTTFKLKSLTEKPLADNTFVFDAKSVPGVEVVDLRD